MTLVATPGAADADSYGTLAEANTYFASRGVSTWAGTDPAKENALRAGATYLDNQYRARWIGIRTNEVQSLTWPRVDGSRDPYHPSLLIPLRDLDGFQIGQDVVPVQVKRAQFEAALLVLTGVTLEPRLERGGQIKSKSTGIGPLSKSITYTDGAPAVDRYTVVEGLLRGLVTSTPGASSGTVKLVRC